MVRIIEMSLYLAEHVGRKRRVNLRHDGMFLWCFRRKRHEWRRSPVLLRPQLQLRSHLRSQLQFQLLLRLQL